LERETDTERVERAATQGRPSRCAGWAASRPACGVTWPRRFCADAVRCRADRCESPPSRQMGR